MVLSLVHVCLSLPLMGVRGRYSLSDDDIDVSALLLLPSLNLKKTSYRKASNNGPGNGLL